MAGETTTSQSSQERVDGALTKSRQMTQQTYNEGQQKIKEMEFGAANTMYKLNEKSNGVFKIIGYSILLFVLFSLSYIILSMLCNYNMYNTMEFSILYILIFGIVFICRYILNSFWYYFTLIVISIIIIWIMGTIFANNDGKYEYNNTPINIVNKNVFTTFIPIYTSAGQLDPKSNTYGIVSVITTIIINLICILVDDYKPTEQPSEQP